MDLRDTSSLIAQWPIRRRKKALYREFVTNRNVAALRKLLDFTAENGMSLEVTREDVRESLFSFDWKTFSDQIEPTALHSVFRALDDYVISSSFADSSGEWRSWIRMSRAAGRVLAVTEPALAQALLTAKRQGKFHSLPQEDSDYLLSCYLQRYGEILERSLPADRHLILPILLEFSAIAQVLGQTEYSSAILQRWTKDAQQRPRSLAGFSDEAAFDAPLRGVGSPNGTSVTMYRDGRQTTPARVAYAGITGDLTLNAHIFSCLFSAALTSDISRSFVTSVGGVLHLDADRGVTSSAVEPLLHAVMEPSGRPGEPVAGIPTLGMRPEDAFQIVDELFQRFKDRTGLVSVMDWALDDANAIEERIRTALSVENKTTCRIRNESGHSEDGSVVHVMPLLHRTPDGEVAPVRIRISYGDLNPEAALRLTRTARQSYMMQLIANGRRREAVATDAHREHAKAVKEWEALTEAQKQAKCKADPIVQINQSYDFELGITKVVDPPREVPLTEYENVIRPDLRNWAKVYAEKFAALCDTLEKLNRTGSVADTLTFKFLLDASIRHDKVLIADPQFQKEYEIWIHTSAPVWGLVEEWAAKSQYPIDLLAADNILFDSELDPNEKIVWIRPHVMIDLHDFEIVADASAGVMYVFPGGHSRSIRERMIPSPSHGITDPKTLQEQFRRWVEERLEILAERSEGERSFREKVLSDKRLMGIVFLQQGKRLLHRGELELSIAAFERARSSDLAPVYFWGAIAHQCRSLSLRENLLHVPRSSNASMYGRQLIKMAFHVLIASMNPAAPRSSTASLWTQDLEVPIHKPAPSDVSVLPQLDSEARMYWSQLCARDPQFVQCLMKKDTDVEVLAAASLNITAGEAERVKIIIDALVGLDFLSLAEKMKTVASAMPFVGLPSNALQKQLKDIVKSAWTLPFYDPPGGAQVEELISLLP